VDVHGSLFALTVPIHCGALSENPLLLVQTLPSGQPAAAFFSPVGPGVRDAAKKGGTAKWRCRPFLNRIFFGAEAPMLPFFIIFIYTVFLLNFV